MPLVKEKLHLYSPHISFRPLKATTRLTWPPVNMRPILLLQHVPFNSARPLGSLRQLHPVQAACIPVCREISQAASGARLRPARKQHAAPPCHHATTQRSLQHGPSRSSALPTGCDRHTAGHTHTGAGCRLNCGRAPAARGSPRQGHLSPSGRPASHGQGPSGAFLHHQAYGATDRFHTQSVHNARGVRRSLREAASRRPDSLCSPKGSWEQEDPRPALACPQALGEGHSGNGQPPRAGVLQGPYTGAPR